MRALVVALVWLLVAPVSIAQDSAPFEPEFVGVFAASDPVSGNVVALTRETSNRRHRLRGLGIGGGESYLEFPGPRCATRIPRGANFQFIVRVAPDMIERAIDPQDLVEFFQLRTLGNIRRLQLVNAGFVGMRVRSTENDAAVPFDAVRHGVTSYAITPHSPVTPGEYFLRLGEDHDSFCFGVDP